MIAKRETTVIARSKILLLKLKREISDIIRGRTEIISNEIRSALLLKVNKKKTPSAIHSIKLKGLFLKIFIM